MANFYYESVDENNEIIKGNRLAASEEEVASFLKLKKYTIITIEEKKEPANIKNLANLFSGKININEKASFIRNLATMIKSGLPIAEAIEVIADTTKSKKFKDILTNIKYDIESGQPLSKSLAKYPDTFDEIFVSLISAGEMSGNLPEVLENLFVQTSKNIDLRNKIISAFAYPIVVLIALFIMGAVMLIVVVPKITEVFTRMQIQLPLALQILQFLSLLFIQYWFLTFPAIIIIVILIVYFFRSSYGEKLRSYFIRVIPIFSTLAKYYDMARLTSVLSLMLRSGVPMIDSLRIVASGIIDHDLKKVVIACEKQVREGKSLSQALAVHPKEISPMLIKITKVGEKSGKMDQVLSELGEYYDGQVNFTLKTISDLIEPVLMLFVGLVVAVLVLSIISPIYKLIGSFSGK